MPFGATNVLSFATTSFISAVEAVVPFNLTRWRSVVFAMMLARVHVRQLARKYNISQRLALAEQMSLTDDIVDSLWAHSLRQRC